MTDLKSLTKPQWDAANAAAKVLTTGDINCPADRLAYRTAKMELALLLPDDADVADVIRQAAQRRMLDAISTVVETPGITIFVIDAELKGKA